jgi:hypothetical protein
MNNFFSSFFGNMKSVFVALFLSVLTFISVIGTVLYFAVQGNISFWWLLLAVPGWFLMEIGIVLFAFNRFAKAMDETSNEFNKRFMHGNK